jgi:predicted N-acetyltransferase YhbS
VWALEAGRALDGPRRALHMAFVDGDYAAPVAFAAADGNNQGLGWFGPAGTDPGHRGKKLGEALLLRCLEDVRGLPEGGVIAWIGPKEFYAKACGAADDRRFVTLERPAP